MSITYPDLNSQIQDLYRTVGGKEADAEGLSNWNRVITSGQSSLSELQNALAADKSKMQTIAPTSAYSAPTTTSAPTYTAPAPTQSAPDLSSQISNLYQQVAGTGPDAEGLTNWSRVIGSGQSTLEDLRNALTQAKQGTAASTAAASPVNQYGYNPNDLINTYKTKYDSYLQENSGAPEILNPSQAMDLGNGWYGYNAGNGKTDIIRLDMKEGETFYRWSSDGKGGYTPEAQTRHENQDFSWFEWAIPLAIAAIAGGAGGLWGPNAAVSSAASGSVGGGVSTGGVGGGGGGITAGTSGSSLGSSLGTGFQATGGTGFTAGGSGLGLTTAGATPGAMGSLAPGFFGAETIGGLAPLATTVGGSTAAIVDAMGNLAPGSFGAETIGGLTPLTPSVMTPGTEHLGNLAPGSLGAENILPSTPYTPTFPSTQNPAPYNPTFPTATNPAAYNPTYPTATNPGTQGGTGLPNTTPGTPNTPPATTPSTGTPSVPGAPTPTTGAGSGNGINLASLLGLLYGAHSKNQMSNQLGDILGELRNMYKPGSPEAQLMQRKLEARDAARGRRSQYGPRETELAGMLAGERMKALTSPGFMTMQAAMMNNNPNTGGLSEILAALANGSSGGGIDLGSLLNTGLIDGEGWLSNLFN